MNFIYIDPLIVLAFFLVFPINIYYKAIFASALTLGDLGVIWLCKSPISDLSLKTIALSYIIANVLGICIANRLQQFRQKQYNAFLQEQYVRIELEKVAFMDPLTGALNRRGFFQLGSLEFSRSKSVGKSFVIIMLDLDFFKSLNDEFGHAVGDDYLQEFTKIIVENKRSNDILGRMGGEEFAIILPEISLTSALVMAERLRRVCEERILYSDSRPVRTTVSIGVTNVWRNDNVFQDVLTRADKALYQAKGKGRNKVELIIETA